MSIHPSVFRRYDIRGVVGSELPIDQIYDLVRAIAVYFVRHNVGSVALGMDGRTHSPAIKQEAVRALQDSGLEVVFLGLCPSPALYFALHTLPVDAGIMITASHNPQEYNGLKINLGHRSVWGDALQEIVQLLEERAQVETTTHGMYREEPIVPPYLNWLVDHFSSLAGWDAPLVFDCGNGVAGTVMPELIKRMRWRNAHLLCAEVDGTYSNHIADPTVAENMTEVRDMMQRIGAPVGIGFDGDADRMGAMGPRGRLYAGDVLLALFAQQVLRTHSGATVVTDVKASNGLGELLEQWGANLVFAPVGHAIIKETMEQHKAILGGELSCHFLFHDRYFGYDDGIYAALRLLEIICESGKDLDGLAAIFPHKFSSPELRLACSDDHKEEVITAVAQKLETQPEVEVSCVDGIRMTTPDGWALLRVSNTQPMVSLRFESETQEGFTVMRDLLVRLLREHIDTAPIAACQPGGSA